MCMPWNLILRGSRGRRAELWLQDGPLERPAGLEARHAAGRNHDGLARPGIPAVALGAPGDQEGAEAADGHLPALPEGVHDLVQERAEGALRGDLGSARGLRHGRHEVRLRHGSSYLRERGGESQEAWKSDGDALDGVQQRIRDERLLEDVRARVLETPMQRGSVMKRKPGRQIPAIVCSIASRTPTAPRSGFRWREKRRRL